MSTPTIAHTVSARWLHSSIAIGSMFLIMAAIAIVLMLSSPSGATPASRSIPVGVDIYTALDQHERHPAGFTNVYAPLDQHERHPAGLTNVYAPLDQHERHPAANPVR